MQYLCLIYSTENVGPAPGSSEFADYIQQYHQFTDRVKKAGVFVDGNALQPTATATTVTRENGDVETTDGPFAETKEQLGGYYLLDCDNLDDALSHAAHIPTAVHGRIEVRPLMVFDS